MCGRYVMPRATGYLCGQLSLVRRFLGAGSMRSRMKRTQRGRPGRPDGCANVRRSGHVRLPEELTIMLGWISQARWGLLLGEFRRSVQMEIKTAGVPLCTRLSSGAGRSELACERGRERECLPKTDFWARISGARIMAGALQVQGQTPSDEEQPEDEECGVPHPRSPKVVPHVVNLQEMMIDQSLHDVEQAPSRQHQAEVKAPAGSPPSSPP